MGQLVPFNEFGGLDLVSHEPDASPLRARAIKNVQKRRSNAIVRRQGMKAIATNSSNNGGFGLAVYNRRNISTGAVTREELIIGEKLFKRTEYVLTINYGGTGQAVAEVIADSDTGDWYLKLYVDSMAVLEKNLGTGIDEASPVTIDDLVTAIGGITDFTASTTGGGSEPAAFLPYTAPTQIEASGSVTITFSVTTQCNQPSGAANPFHGAFTNRNAEAFENVSTAQLDDIILFCSKWDSQKKYDGSDCYRVGCPAAGSPSLAGSGAGGLAAGTYKYAAIIVQVDAQGNRVEGIESATVSITTGAPQNINVTLSNVLNTTGFNTDCAIVNGAQVGVNTITVDDGSGGNHSMKVGQTAYFWDGASASYVERLITAVSSTTITIAGTAVNVADNAVISNNLRLMILRTVSTGEILKELVEVPNNSFAATQVYNDGTADSSLGADYTSPSLDGVEHGLPPNCGYICIYNGRPLIAGNLEDPDSFYWASQDGSEYYPSIFTDYVQGDTNSSISGIASGDRFAWIHKTDESFLLTGNLFSGQYNTSQKGDKVGCLAHASIVRSDRAMIWLGGGAVFESIDGGTPERISDDISSALDLQGLSDEQMLAFKRAVGVYDRNQEIYILFLPAESENGGDVYPNSESRIFVYDTRRKEWWEWDTWNMAGGAAISGTDLVWTERRLSALSSTVSYLVYKRLNTNTNYDYIDHSSDIQWLYDCAGSIHLGQPSVNKKFPYLELFCMDLEKAADYTLTAEIEKDFVPGINWVKLVTQIGQGGNGGWGFGAWGFFPWGNPRANSTKVRRLRDERVKAIRFRFSSSGIYNEIILGGINLQVEAPFKIDINEARRNS